MDDSIRTRSVKRRLVALGVGLGMALGVLAGAEHCARDGEMGDMILVFDPPARKFALPPSDKFKDRGWREGMDVPEKPAGLTRIICVGDSLTYGVQVSPREAWPYQLHTWLRDQTGHGTVEVRNFGLNGWDAEQVASLTTSGLDEWEPDLIIWGSFGNDLEPTRLLHGQKSGDPIYVGSEIPEEIRILPESWAMTLRKHSALYRGWLGTRYSRWASGQRRQDRDDPEFYARHLGALQTWASNTDIPLLVVAIPSHVLSDMEACPQSFSGDVGPCNVALSRHEQIVDLLKESDVNHLDLLPVFQSSGHDHFHPESRNDPDHPNAVGHRLIATSLLPWIHGQLGLEDLMPEPSGG